MPATTMMTMMTTKLEEQFQKEVHKWLRNEREEGQRDHFWRLFEAERAAENALTALMNGFTQQIKNGQFPGEGTQLFFNWLESVQHCLEVIAALHRISLNRLKRLLPRLLARSKSGRNAKLSPVVVERYDKAVAAADSFSEGVLLLCLQAAQHVEQEALEKWKAGMQRVLEEIFRILRQKEELLQMLLSPEESQREASSQEEEELLRLAQQTWGSSRASLRPPSDIQTAITSKEGEEGGNSEQTKVGVRVEPLQPSFGKPWLHESVWGGWKQKSRTDRYARKWDE